MKTIKFILVPCLLLAVIGCQSIPQDIFKLSPDSLKNRQLQTRQYETTDEENILNASAGVLQDLGFTIDDSESELGLLSASKDRDATDAGQIVLATLATAAASFATRTYQNYYELCDKNQKIKASLVSRLNEAGDKMLVRVTFQRIVWNGKGQVSKVETLKDEEMYQGFFDKLSKSVFLEEQKI